MGLRSKIAMLLEFALVGGALVAAQVGCASAEAPASQPAGDVAVRTELSLNRADLAAEYLDRGRARSLLDILERAKRDSGPTTQASAADIQGLLKPHQHLLMYSIDGDDAVVLLVPPPGESIAGTYLTEWNRTTHISGDELGWSISDYRQSVLEEGLERIRGVHRGPTTRPIDLTTEEKGEFLFHELMPASVWKEIQHDELVYVVPDTAMSGLPLETLILNADKRTYWLDDGPPVCYEPSAGVLLELRRMEPDRSHRKYLHEAVLLGNPGTRDDEVKGIYQALTGKAYANQTDHSVVVLVGEDASNDRLMEAAHRTRYLHLATDGVVETGMRTIYSRMVLSQPKVVTPEDTGVLTLQDLLDHWWGRLDGTELVVLSASNSDGLDEKGANVIANEGVFGLPWGFMYAGSGAVVASLWEVEDASTARLMKDFYTDLKSQGGGDKLAAFTAARKQVKQQYPEPFFWAPFIYLGDPR